MDSILVALSGALVAVVLALCGVIYQFGRFAARIEALEREVSQLMRRLDRIAPPTWRTGDSDRRVN